MSKQSSRWGSLLSGAVAGIESRLDTILAEEGAQKQAPNGTSTPSAESEKSLSRAPSTRKTDPRRRPTSSRASPQPRSETQSPAPPPSQPRASFDSSQSETPICVKDVEQRNGGDRASTTDEDGPRISAEGTTFEENTQTHEGHSELATRSSADHHCDKDTDEDLDGAFGRPSAEVEASKSREELQLELSQARDDHEKVELRRQEEVHEYMERIDALQAKLQYLAREVTSSARQIASEASNDSFEKKLAEKDEKISLLMDEGTKLSKTEVSQAGTIRNLRAKIAEDSKEITEAKRRAVKAERSMAESASDVSRLEADRKDLRLKISRLSRFEKDASSLKRQLAEKDAAMIDLQRQLEDANQRAEDEQREARNKALEEEQKVSHSLREDLTDIRKEQTKRDEKNASELKKAQEKMQREADRNRASEMGLKNEVSLLESRLEALRERSEEASVGSTGDAHAKLMRQVETLQSQYALASENWQGIESSLQTRVTALEKERDDSSRHENEARKKARDSGSSARRLQSQLDDTTQRCQLLEHDLTEQTTEAEVLRKRASECEKSLQNARIAFEQEKHEWTAALQARIEHERAKWQQQHTPTSAEPSLALNSPHSSFNRKASMLEFPGLTVRKSSARQGSELNLASLVRPVSRRSSALPNRNSEAFSPTNGNTDSGPPTPLLNGPQTIHEAPSIHTNDQDEGFETGSSPRRTVNDMLSASTANAGPSVQLVERMSANVRRLESEKAASKDELVRLQAQRDEGRTEIVALMQEVEQKRAVDTRVAKLERDLGQVNERYQTTLELLGEKSERVGELEADVADLKKIYRELLDNTMK